MTFFLNKFLELKEHYKSLKKRFENLDPLATDLEQLNPYLIQSVNNNKKIIDNKLLALQDMLLSIQEGEGLSSPIQYARYIDTLGREIVTRECYYDTLRQAIYQRQNPELKRELIATDMVLRGIFDSVGINDRPIIINLSSENFPGYMHRISKKIGVPYSILDDISCLSVIAHEVAHEILGNFCASLQVLFYATMRTREEFSRRYGIERGSFDKLIDSVDSIPSRQEDFIEDMKTYFITHPEIIQTGQMGPFEDIEEQGIAVEQLSDRVVEFLTEIKEDIPVIEEFFSDLNSWEDLIVRLSWIGEIVSDLFEIKIMGPFSFFTSIKISNIEHTNFDWSRVHPPDTFRLFFMKEILNSNDLGDVVEDNWNEWINELPPDIRREFDNNRDFLLKILNFINGFLEREGQPENVFTREDYSKSETVADKLSDGQTIENEEINIILNAAQIAIRNGVDKTNVNELVIESLYKKSNQGS